MHNCECVPVFCFQSTHFIAGISPNHFTSIVFSFYHHFTQVISLAGRKKAPSGSSKSGSAKDTNQSSETVSQPPSGHRTRSFTGSTPNAGGNGNEDDEEDDRRKKVPRQIFDKDEDAGGKGGRLRSNKKAKTADAGSGSKPQKKKTLPAKKPSSSKTLPVKKASSSKSGAKSKSKNSTKSTSDKAQKAAQQPKSKGGVIATNASGPDPVDVSGASGISVTQDDPVEKQPAGKPPLPPLPIKGPLAKLHFLDSGETFPFNICASYPKCNHSTGLCDVESSPNFCEGGCGYYIHRGSMCSFKGSLQGPASGPADVCVYCHLKKERPSHFHLHLSMMEGERNLPS
jgi:hypothetical protein